jgi:hypothetical protein
MRMAASNVIGGYSFEYTLNTEAIRNALKRSDLFVFFLSANSIRSSFVAEELRAALEDRSRGFIRQVLIFSLDATSYQSLPEWLRDINIVRRLSSQKACARKIQAALIALETEKYQPQATYLGREEEEAALRKALSAAPGVAPVAIHAVGHFGIGRHTFLRHSLSKLYPRFFNIFIDIVLAQNEGPEELYRRLYEYFKVASLDQTARDFERFSLMDERQQVEVIADILTEMSLDNEFVIIDDQGGAYTDAGAYQTYLSNVISTLSGSSKPILGFAQTRMMPFNRRRDEKASYHTYLNPLPEAQIKELLSFSLKAAGVDFDDAQLQELSALIDGHPFNVRFTVSAIESYGLPSFLADPVDLIEWKRRRAEDFLALLKFDSVDCDLIAALVEYRFLPLEMFAQVLKSDAATVARSLRRLEEQCCIERRGEYYEVSAPIRDAVGRDPRFERSDDWKRKVGEAICESLVEYKDDEHVSVALLDSAVMAAVRGVAAPRFISSLILPSHLLVIARRYYDKRQPSLCLEFCKRAYAMKSRLTEDAKIEVLRLWGLSAERAGEEEEYKTALKHLNEHPSSIAKRHAFFVEGFHLRRHNRFDEAETKFLECWKLSRDNQSVNRELAQLYCKQRQYNEAEAYARSAYATGPTNPFIIDVLAETLLGKQQAGFNIDKSELARVMEELKRYGDAPGSAFYLIREAQTLARDRKFSAALDVISRAIERTDNILPPYFIRADILIQMSDVAGAERDKDKIDELLQRQGGFSEGDEIKLLDLSIRLLIERQQFKTAKDKIDLSNFLPNRLQQRLLRDLVRAIGFVPQAATREMAAWAKSFSEKK